MSPAPYQACSEIAGNLIGDCGFEGGIAGRDASWTSRSGLEGLGVGGGHTGDWVEILSGSGGVAGHIGQPIKGAQPGQTYVLGFWLQGAVPTGSSFAATVSGVEGGTRTFDETTERFDGWRYFQDSFVASSGTPVLDFSGLAPNSSWLLDDVVVAKGFQVTFDTDGGAPTPAPQVVLGGAHATAPTTNPAKAGYTFSGWFTQAGAPWAFATDTVASDRTLVAHYTQIAPAPSPTSSPTTAPAPTPTPTTAPQPTAAPSPPPHDDQLPVTGSDTSAGLSLGLAAMAVGAVLLLLARRRAPGT